MEISSNRLTALAIFVASTASCAGSTDVTAPRDQGWRLEEVWRVGGEVEGPRSFDAIFDLTVTPSGHILHFDYKTALISELDGNGSPVRQFGRHGAGPGEYNNSNGFEQSHDGRIVVNDRLNNRFVLFDSAGTATGEIPLPWKYTRPLRWDATFLDDGRLVERYAVPDDSGGWQDLTRIWSPSLDNSRILGIDSCTVSSSTAGGHVLAPILTPDGLPMPRQYVPVPFSGAWTATAVDPRGFIWAQPAIGDSTIIRYALEGCVQDAMIQLSTATPRIPEAAIDSALTHARSAAALIGGRLQDDLEVPTHFPLFFTIHVDQSGNVWVGRFGAEGETVMEIHDSLGQLIGRIDPFPLNTRAPLIITTDYVYGILTDDEGIKYLARFRIHRQS